MSNIRKRINKMERKMGNKRHCHKRLIELTDKISDEDLMRIASLNGRELDDNLYSLMTQIELIDKELTESGDVLPSHIRLDEMSDGKLFRLIARDFYDNRR